MLFFYGDRIFCFNLARVATNLIMIICWAASLASYMILVVNKGGVYLSS